MPNKILLVLTFVLQLTTSQSQPMPDADKFADLSEEIARIVKDNKAVGISVAIIDNYKIAYAKGFGTTLVNSRDSVTTATLFQIASLTKSFVAMAVMRQVELGTISLSDNIDARLTSWHIPKNHFTNESPITVKHLLSHTGGVSNSFFAGYDPDYTLPTIAQTLDGMPPAKNEPVKIVALPGSRYAYSNCGYWILAQLLEDLTKREMGNLIEEDIFQPLGMTNSTFDRKLPSQRFPSVAYPHLSKNRPMENKYLVYQPVSAGGMWSTATDLANFLIEMQRSIKGESNKLLSKENSHLMITPVMNEYGLGFTNEVRGTGVRFFGHGGHNVGYKAIMLASIEGGFGVVILSNSENGDNAGDKILKMIGRKYWGF